MNCELCQSNSPLQNSHIIPEFFYTQLYEDKIHRFQIVPADSLKLESFEQKGVREKLLCRACEQKFGRWESYTKTAFGNGIGIKIERNEKTFTLSNLDYRRFRLFLLSLLWRMGVSKLDFFADVKLGNKHERILRLALLNEDPLESSQYPCLMSAIHINNRFYRDGILPPMHVRSIDQHCYCVFINGILFWFYVASHPLTSGLAEACISRENKLSVFVGEIREVRFLAEYASNLSSAIRSRKQLGEVSLQSL